MTPKQYENAITAAGMWFFLTQYEIIKYWPGTTKDLVDYEYKKGFDSTSSGTSVRVSSVKRIISAGMEKDALLAIKGSIAIKRNHPEAEVLAEMLLKTL